MSAKRKAREAAQFASWWEKTMAAMIPWTRGLAKLNPPKDAP